jgi:hypothetical protein
MRQRHNRPVVSLSRKKLTDHEFAFVAQEKETPFAHLAVIFTD